MGGQMHWRGAALVAAIAACSLALAACGGSAGAFSKPLDTVRAFQKAVDHHDSRTACSALTDSFKAAMIPGKVGIYSWKTCDQLAHVAFAHNVAVLIREAQIGKAGIHGNNAGVAIRMKLNISDSPEPATVYLVRHGGGWQIDDLCALGACFKAAFIARRSS